jgi:flagellar FliL protein
MKRLFAICRISLALAAPLLALPLAGGALAADQEPEKAQIAYYPLKPSIVTNLSGGPKYIRCDIQLMTKSAMDLPQIELHSPALRHDILMLIAGQDGNQLKSRDGKEDLRKATLASVQERLTTLTGKPIVDDLYFTAYYVK